MAVTRLTLTDFRSYAAAELSVGEGFVVLTGDNGAGKTNVLEAVSLLAPGRGLRGATTGDMARHGGSGGLSLSAVLADGTRIGTGTLPQAPERRLVRINGASVAANALSERLSVVWLTPAQDRLFTDSAGARRRFLDRLVLAVEPGHARHVTRYEAAMRERNRLLTEGRADPAWLDALEAAMAEHGAAITEARLRLVVALAEQPEDATFPTSRLQLSNVLIEGLRERLAASRQRDTAVGRALHGPQAQDLLVTFAAKDRPAAQSSTGEQKALLIGLVLAHAALVAERCGQPPVLLLDEVAAHLDPGRRTALFARLTGCGQVWMTGTEASAFAELREADRLVVADNAIGRRP